MIVLRCRRREVPLYDGARSPPLYGREVHGGQMVARPDLTVLYSSRCMEGAVEDNTLACTVHTLRSA